MRVGIVTIQNAYNYGSTLQAYALQQFLCGLGHDVVIIDYQNRRLNEIYHSSSRIKEDISHILSGHIRSGAINILEKVKAHRENMYVQVSKKYEKYRKKYLCLSEKVTEDRLDLLLEYDVLITGSDQVWNVEITNGEPIYYLSIPNFMGIKVAYAASGSIQNDMSKIDMIKDIDRISVREESLQCELKKYLESDIEKVCDPTLLIHPSVWRKQIKSIPEHYIFAYLMWDEPLVLDYLNEVSQRKRLPVVILHRMQKYVVINGKRYASASPSDFMSLIAYADYVVSNSFHGTVFSVLFEKQFLAYASGDRVVGFLDMLKLSDRTIGKKHTGDIDLAIDWARIKDIIAYEASVAKNFIQNALKESR